MSKVNQFFSTLKGFVSSKYLWVLLAIFLILLGIWFWFSQKSKESLIEHNFVIATDSRWFPLDLHGQEQYMQGFISELTAMIAKEESINIQVISQWTSQLYDNLDKGYYDAVIGTLEPDVINEEKYLFSKPLYLTGPVLIVPMNSTKSTIKQLSSLGIKSGFAIPRSTFGLPLVYTIHYDNMNMALSELISGKIDGLLMDSLDAYAYIQGYYADKLKVVTPPLNEAGLRLITLHEFYGRNLVEMFDKALENLKEDKTYDKLLQNWDLVNPETAYKK